MSTKHNQRLREAQFQRGGGQILGYLQAQAGFMARINNRIGRYTGLADFLLQHGRQFAIKPFPGEFRRGKAQHCFKNCAQLAMRYSRLTYCEGYAAGVIPVLHAWLMDSDGQAIDPTWTGNDRPQASDYYGVPIKTRYVIEHAASRSLHAPMLDDWSHNFPILFAPMNEWKAGTP